MLILDYPSKKEMKAAIGQKLKYTDPSITGKEYQPTGVMFGSNRPHLTGHKREFYAQVTLKDDLIVEVK
jgi:hypothetical protein